MNIIYAACFLLLLVSISSGGRTNRLRNECSMKCNSNQDNLFKAGKAYTYQYQGQSEIKTSSGSYDSTGLLVKSKVIITAFSNCEMKLKMTDVEMFDKFSKEENGYKPSPFTKTASEILEKNEVLFSRLNGEIKSVCMDENEPIWSQNMKKSILDILANEGKKNKWLEQRKTRHGECFVETLVPNDLTKTVAFDLKSCDSIVTQSLFTDLVDAMIFNVSSVNCKYAYKTKNNLETVHCTEDYITTPLRKNDNSVNVKVTTRLERSESKVVDMSYPKNNFVKSGIEMKIDVEETSKDDFMKTKETIKLMCNQHVSGKRSEIPRSFMTLVNQLKKLTSTEVKDIYMEILKTDICPGQNEDLRSMFYDAIGFVNTPSATYVMVDLIKNKQISKVDQAVWFTSLSFMQTTPTLEMIKDLETLLQTEETSKQMYLGISAVTHLYCKDNYETCLMDHTIRNILLFYLDKLGKDCAVSANNENMSKIQLALKSLGNLKVFNEDVVSILSKCATTKANPTAIRVSALEVMKHMDCTKDRSAAMEILQEYENDSEMRISAYLTIMGCPDINTMFKVREILSKEKVNQVGSFIWTHLTNIQESNDIIKQDIQNLLNDVKLKKEFDISKLKFSRNIEKTFQIGQFGMTVDSNVIFSEKSFIPRSVSLNTTASVLGRPTNFIEMSARMEGLDDLLFKLLGPDGYLKKQKESTAKDNMALIKMLEAINGNINLKLFGQQISFVELIRGSLSSVKKYNIIEEIMNFGQEKTMEFKKNLILLDKVANIQTSMGFPIKFRVQGSVAVMLKIKSKIDLSGLMKWPVSVNIESHISPSVMSEFTSEVTLETPFSKYGMSARMKSGTDTELKALISASKNEEFNIKFDTPKSKQEIISVSGKSFVIFRDTEYEQLTKNVQKYEICSPERFKRILGIKICGNAEVTDAETRKTALLYGPFSASFYIEKQDSQTGYLIKGLLKTVPFISETGIVYKSRFLRFEMNTPQSKLYNRRFAVDMALDFKENVIKFQADSPWNQILMKSTFALSDKKKSALILLEVDNKSIVKIEMEHSSIFNNNKHSESGILKFGIMNLKPFETKWSFNGKRDKWNVKFESKGLLKDKTYFNLEVNEIKSTRQLSLFNKYKLEGTYETFFGKGKISGGASENYYGHRWDIKLNHTPKTNPTKQYTISYRHKTEDKGSKNLLKYFLTSTITYGYNSENFLKLQIENEISGRHIRASVKTSYGETKEDNTKRTEEIDLQLYGGFTWKDNNRHYAEGSLSFKFPSKGVNYEGRYNSEVGKQLFKMAIVLDKDQHSKVNFKINYLQPKLYLKDTECDITLSFPNYNTNLKWNLKEIDVNKYEYALIGGFNNYVFKANGIQTEISKLKYDSSIKIALPAIKHLPENVNVDFRIDFVNPSDARLNGKIEIPNSKHKYSVDLKLSSIPQNFLQLPISERSSVFKYKLEISTMERNIQSESIFTCNPEEMQVYFNMDWNANKKNDQQIAFDFHTVHKSPNQKQYDNSARISVRYPGNSHSIGLKSEFKFTELEAQIDLTWNKNQRITVLTTYEIDNSWTQKGIKASLTMKTPFNGLELTHLGINAVGQLRYRKVDIEFKWGGNKKILFDIVIQPRSSNDFTLTSKLVTPFPGMTLISLHANHIGTINSITSEASLELGPKVRYNIKFEGMNNNEGKNRDIASKLYIESGIFPPLKISFLHKDDKVHYKSKFDVNWMKTKNVNIKSDFAYTFDESELVTNGNLELQSTIKEIKQMKATWSMENKESTFINNIQLFYNSNNVFHNSIKGFFEKEEENFKMQFTGFMRVMSSQPLRVTNVLTFEKSSLFVNNFSIMKDTIPLYSHNIEIKHLQISFKVFIPSTEFKTAEFKGKYKTENNEEVGEAWLKAGEVYIFKKNLKLNYINDEEEIDIVSEFYSDYLRQKTINSKAKIIIKRLYFKMELESKSQSSVLVKTLLEISTKPTEKVIKFLLKTPLKEIRLVEFDLQSITNINAPVNKFNFNYNGILKTKSMIQINGFQFIEIDLLYEYKEFVSYLKMKHDQKLMGYEHLLETNLFETTLKIVSSTEKRGGFALHTTLNCNNWILKSLDIVGRFSKSTSQLAVIYTYPRSEEMDEVIKLEYSRKKSFYNLNIVSKKLISATLKIDLKDFKTFVFEFKPIGIEGIPKINVNMDYEGGVNSAKYSNEIKISLGKRNFHLQNKFEKVTWIYLLVESQLRTNIEALSNYKIGAEYKKGPSNLEMIIKFFFNEIFLTASAKSDLPRDIKSVIKIESSFPILREILFDVKHIQNIDRTQLTHSCKISVKSNDCKFELSNNVEWSGVNYIRVESSIVARTSKDNYFIEPKLIKFVHQLYKNVLKEEFQLKMSEKNKFKANFNLKDFFITDIQLILKENYVSEIKADSIVELESTIPTLSKLKITTQMDSTNKKLSWKLYIEKNEERLFNLISVIEKNKNKISMLVNIEETGSHLMKIEYERKNSAALKIDLKAESTLLTKVITMTVAYDSVAKEGSLVMKGVGKENVELSGRIKINSAVINFNYGKKVVNLNYLIDDSAFKLNGELKAENVAKIDVQVSRKSVEINLLLNENEIKFSNIPNSEMKLHINVRKTLISLTLKTLSTVPYKYEISGRTSFSGWSSFAGDVYYVQNLGNMELTTTFSRENNQIYNIIIRNLQKSFELKYQTMFDVLKMGEISANYESKPYKLAIKINGETIDQKKIKVNLKLEGNVIEGDISSSFEWMEKALITGEIRSQNDEVTGSFKVTHNKLEKPLEGELSYKFELTSWEVNIKTPFSSPFNKLSLTKKSENGQASLQLINEENRIFIISLDTSVKTKTVLLIDINIPEPLVNFKINLNTLINIEDIPYLFKVTLKSNLFQEIHFQSTFNPIEQNYIIMFTHPSKEGKLQAKFSWQKISFSSEYNGKSTSIYFSRETGDLNQFDGKFQIKSNMYLSNPLNLEIRCKHNIDLQKEVSINLETKWDDKTVFSTKTEWKKGNLNGFDFKSKLLLNPYDKEYESSVEIFNKDNEEYSFTFSPLGDSKLNDIVLKFVNKFGEMQLLVKTPYKPIEKIDIYIKTESSVQQWKNIIRFNSNYLGKMESITEHKRISRLECITTSSFTSPYKYGNIDAQVKLRSKEGDENIEIRVDANTKIHQMKINRKGKKIDFKINSDNTLIRTVEITFEKDQNSYTMSTTFNDFKASGKIEYSERNALITLKSNTEYAKVITLSLTKSVNEDQGKNIEISLKKDDAKLEMKMNYNAGSVSCEWKNSLLPFLPNHLQGNYKYTQRPLIISMELKMDSKSLVNLLLQEKEFLFNIQTTLSKGKIHIKPSRFEMIFLDQKVFSVLINQPTTQQIDVNLMVNSVQYSTALKFENNKDKVLFKVTTYQNSLDKLFEMYIFINKLKTEFDSELNILTKPIFKIKFLDKLEESRKISTEIRLLFLTAVFDIDSTIKNELVDIKMFWNWKLDERQLTQGSVVYAQKWSTPINCALILNLPTGAYQFQLSEMDDKTYNLKVLSPYKEANLEVSVLSLYNPSMLEYKALFSLKNEILGEHKLSLYGSFDKDYVVKLGISTNMPILEVYCKIKTSSIDEYSILLTVKKNSLKKIELETKLSVKEKVKIFLKLETPFTLLKHISIEKTLWINSGLEHKFETIMEYRGIMNIKYTGGHEISFIRKVIKFNGNLETEEVKIVSLNIHSFKDENGIDHMFVMNIKERRYGYRINGRLNPLFRGKTEIYTPFHNSGVLVLQGGQIRGGIKIQVGREKEEVSGFEYQSNSGVNYMKITPPTMYGKPLAVKYIFKRHRRSLQNTLQGDITYGDQTLLNLNTKVNLENDKTAAIFKINSPMFSKKSAELKLMHKFEGDTMLYHHNLKIKDDIEKIYKIFGNIYHKDFKNFEIAFNIHRPYLDPFHFSVGQNTQKNTHNSYLIIKHNNKEILMHKGKIVAELKNINGEWEFQIPKRHYRIKAFHKGDFENFSQGISSFYNTEPHITYKADIVPQQKSVVEISLPIVNGEKIKLIFDRQEGKINAILSMDSNEYLLETVDKNGQFKALLKWNKEKIASIMFGYGTKPLLFKAIYRKLSMDLETKLEDSSVTIKLMTSSSKLKEATLMLTRNKVLLNINQNGEPLKFSLEYHFVPDNFFLVMETSSKQLSKASIYVTPNEIKLNFNEFFQILTFKLKENELDFNSSSNLHFVKNFRFNVQRNQEKSRFDSIIIINSYSGDFSIEHLTDKLIFNLKNNVFSPKSLNLEFSRISKETAHLWAMILKVDTVEVCKMVAQVSDNKYSIGLSVDLIINAVVSFDQKNNEVIVSLRKGDDFLNIIGKIQRMTTTEGNTFIINTSLDSSVFYFRKISTQLTYTVSKADIFVSLSGSLDKQRFGTKIQLVKSNYLVSFFYNDDIYITRITQKNSEKLTLELITPKNNIKVDIWSENIRYFMDVYYNKENIIKVQIKQNLSFTTSIEHSTMIWYYGQNIWNLNFETDFRKYQLKLTQPSELEIVVINELKDNNVYSLKFWTKYLYYSTKVERGFGVAFKVGSFSELIEIYIENNLHVIKVSKKSYPKLTLSANLLNKVTKNQWDVTVQILENEMFEIFWTSPNGKKGIKFQQVIKNNVRTLVDLEILETMKLIMKSDVKKRTMDGYLSLFGKKIVTLEASDDNIKASINNEGTESNRISLEWRGNTRGEWKKDYLSTRRLIVKQKALNIDIDVKYELRMETLQYALLTKTQYMNIDGETEIIDISGSVDFKTADMITIEFKNPIMPLKTVFKRYQPNKSSLQYDMNTVLNDNDKISGFFTISVGHDMGFSTRLHYNPKNQMDYFQMHAKYIDDRQFEVRIFNENQKITTNYFQFLLRLLNEHKIETTLRYQTDAFSELKSKISSIVNSFENKIVDLLTIKIEKITKEFVKRYTQIVAIIPGGKAIQEKLFLLLQNIKIEIKSYLKEVIWMYENDEFYMRTIVYALSRQVIGILELIIDTYNTIYRTITHIDYEIFYRYISYINCVVTQNTYEFSRLITDPLKETIFQLIENYFPKLSKYIIDNFEYFKNNVQDFSSIIRLKLAEIKKMQKLFVLSQIYNFSVRLTKSLKETFGSITTGSLYFMSQENEIKALYDNIINMLEFYSSRSSEKLNQVISGIDESLYMIAGERYCAKVRALFANFVDYLIKQLRDEGNQKIIKEMIMSSIGDSFIRVNSKIAFFTKDIIIPTYILFNRYNNINTITYVVVFTSPIPLNDFKSLPDLSYVTKKKEEIKSIATLIRGVMKEKILSGQKFISLMGWFTPQIPMGSFPSLIPDFESYATILGSSVLTFDKKSLKLKSDMCKVVLATDMRSKMWEIVLEQNKNGRIYTLRIGNDKVSISINNRKVSWNGKETELPLKFGSTKVMAFGNVVKIKDEILGLIITVDPINDMFTVGVSGWYHGKLRGLFGNADNEPFNDMLGENDKILTNKEFFKTYNNGGNMCDIINEKETNDVEGCPFLRKIACKFLYQCPFSPMAACFGKVDSTKFYNQCVSGSHELAMKMDKSVCASAKAYQAQCSAVGVKVQVPFPCMKCNIKGEATLLVNEERNQKMKEKVADIVFIVDEGRCLKNIRPQLDSIISKLDETMKDKGISSVRFGLVTFRGDDVNEAHTHTINQNLFGSKLEILSSIKSLQSTNQIIKDTTGAITLAASYPFRNHASKHLVLINCDRCEESQSQFKTLIQILEKKAIQFSVLIDYNFQVNDGEHQKIIYGVDQKNAYTPIARQGMKVPEINRPEDDLCYKLAMKENGVVFNINFLISKMEATQKRFIDTFTTQVTLTAKPARTLTCRCADDEEYNCVPQDTFLIIPAKKTL